MQTEGQAAPATGPARPLGSRFRRAFGALIMVQAAHSVEEYLGRLWETFPPARVLSGVISSNRELGFLILNTALVLFGLWCLAGPVRGGLPSARPLAWFWVAIEVVNGLGHPLWSLGQGGYTPGVATAPLLLILAIYTATQVPRLPPG